MQADIAKTGAVITKSALPVITADAGQLAQVLQNLIANAIKFRRDPPPEIRVEAERLGSEWLFSVRDNGIGIDQAAADQIFAPFQRLHGHDRYEGTGIGLAICKRVIDRHGGRIWVEPSPGEGSTFFFTIPA
jgi:light-regulated signal transduction histidine kinase (bacteriophytochrome)